MANTYTVANLLEHVGRQERAIKEVRITPISYKPADGSVIHECGPVVLSKRDEAVVEIWTDDGLKGIGPASVAEAQKTYAELIGKNPFDLLGTDVLAGVDIACWDIVGRGWEKPVYELLAMGRDMETDPRVHVYASGGVMWTYYDRGDGASYGVEALIEEALRYKELGFDTFKWRPGTDWEEAGITPAKLGDICRQLRAAVGDDFKMGLEKKGYDSWTFEQCLEIAPIINELGFYFFEQPMGDVGPKQFADYRQLKEQMPKVMLWGGESLRRSQDAEVWMREGIYDAVQTDCLHIGLTQNWRLGQLAKETGTKMVPHNWSTSLGTMSNAHFVAGVGGHMCEFFMYPSDFRYGLFKEPYRPHDAHIALGNKPGFGVELIDDFAEKFPYIPGPNTLANPRFPHAWERAQAREKAVRDRYVD